MVKVHTNMIWLIHVFSKHQHRIHESVSPDVKAYSNSISTYNIRLNIKKKLEYFQIFFDTAL